MLDQSPTAAAALPPALADVTGYLLRRAYLRVLEVVGETLAGQQPARHLGILMALDTAAAPVSQRWLAESLGLNRTVMGRLVDDLERDGLVERARSATDRRAYALRPTAKGLEAVARGTPELERTDIQLTRLLTATERARLNELLRELLAADPDRRLPEVLADRSGFLITQAHLLMRSRADGALRPLGIEVRHFGAMAVASAVGPCSQQQVARALGVTPPVVVPIIDELEALELVRRERNSADRRSYALRLTPEGERTLAEARERLELLPAGVFDERQATGGPELRALLRRLLGADR
jgi:DNA-binding MarR family transcriptional regulator